MSWSGKRAAMVAAVLVAAVAVAVTFVTTVGAAQPPPSEPPATQVPAPVQASPTPVAGTAVAGVLRVYSNNIENLVRNDPGGACTPISAPEHLASMLVDDTGRTGTGRVVAPDLLLLQQVSGRRQTEAYADQLAAEFGLAAGSYRAIVAWDDPEEWGANHNCRDRTLGDRKKKQTNAIVYNTHTLTLTDTSEHWSAGWLKPGADYDRGRGCTAYEPPSVDADPARLDKWKRTSAIAARFTIRGTDTTVFAATMHLPQQNRRNACAGEADPGIDGTGIGLSADAGRLLERSEIRVIGVDANRTGISSSALSDFGMTGYGTAATIGRSKIDYLFVKGAVRPSSIDHTVAGTKSNHLALYGFIDF